MNCFVGLLYFIARRQPDMDPNHNMFDFLTEQCADILKGKYK